MFRDAQFYVSLILRNSKMSIFKEYEAAEVKVLSPKDWTTEDCKNNLRVQFRALKSRPDCVSVSIRLGGVTPLKIGKNEKMSIIVEKSKADRSVFLETVKQQENLIAEAHQRYVDALNVARTTRHTTKVKPKDKKVSSTLVVNNVTAPSN